MHEPVSWRLHSKAPQIPREYLEVSGPKSSPLCLTNSPTTSPTPFCSSARGFTQVGDCEATSDTERSALNTTVPHRRSLEGDFISFLSENCLYFWRISFTLDCLSWSNREATREDTDGEHCITFASNILKHWQSKTEIIASPSASFYNVVVCLDGCCNFLQTNERKGHIWFGFMNMIVWDNCPISFSNPVTKESKVNKKLAWVNILPEIFSSLFFNVCDIVTCLQIM